MCAGSFVACRSGEGGGPGLGGVRNRSAVNGMNQELNASRPQLERTIDIKQHPRISSQGPSADKWAVRHRRSLGVSPMPVRDESRVEVRVLSQWFANQEEVALDATPNYLVTTVD